MTLELPRFVVGKRLASGHVNFYWEVKPYYRKQGCTIPAQALGSDYTAACAQAMTLNGLFDEWRAGNNGQQIAGLIRIGTVDWLFREYKKSKDFDERVSERTRGDYDYLMGLVVNTVTNKGDKIGGRDIKSIDPRGADKIYERIVDGPKGLRLRQGEKVIVLCRHAWNVVHRLYPDKFNRDVPNPWMGVTKKRRTMATKKAVTREQVYIFAAKAIEMGFAEAGAAAVICYEWLQRPENVLGGYVRWTEYSRHKAIRIEHHKTGKAVLHPLVDTDGTPFYADAENVLAKVERRGIPIVLQKPRNGVAKPYSPDLMSKVVRKIRTAADLPDFTLDACRHGGMTELEEAELTDGQGRALSAHTSRAYEGYAKRTEKRALAATRRRHAHRLASGAAEQNGIELRNEPRNELRNDISDETSGVA